MSKFIKNFGKEIEKKIFFEKNIFLKKFKLKVLTNIVQKGTKKAKENFVVRNQIFYENGPNQFFCISHISSGI